MRGKVIGNILKLLTKQNFTDTQEIEISFVEVGIIAEMTYFSADVAFCARKKVQDQEKILKKLQKLFLESK